MIYLELLGCALLGGLLHWLKKYGKNETAADFFAYIKHKPATTISSLAGMAGAAIVAASQFSDFENPQVFLAVMAAGYISDSVCNEAPK